MLTTLSSHQHTSAVEMHSNGNLNSTQNTHTHTYALALYTSAQTLQRRIHAMQSAVKMVIHTHCFGCFCKRRTLVVDWHTHARPPRANTRAGRETRIGKVMCNTRHRYTLCALSGQQQQQLAARSSAQAHQRTRTLTSNRGVSQHYPPPYKPISCDTHTHTHACTIVWTCVRYSPTQSSVIVVVLQVRRFRGRTGRLAAPSVTGTPGRRTRTRDGQKSHMHTRSRHRKTHSHTQRERRTNTQPGRGRC